MTRLRYTTVPRLLLPTIHSAILVTSPRQIAGSFQPVISGASFGENCSLNHPICPFQVEIAPSKLRAKVGENWCENIGCGAYRIPSNDYRNPKIRNSAHFLSPLHDDSLPEQETELPPEWNHPRVYGRCTVRRATIDRTPSAGSSLSAETTVTLQGIDTVTIVSTVTLNVR